MAGAGVAGASSAWENRGEARKVARMLKKRRCSLRGEWRVEGGEVWVRWIAGIFGEC